VCFIKGLNDETRNWIGADVGYFESASHVQMGPKQTTKISIWISGPSEVRGGIVKGAVGRETQRAHYSYNLSNTCYFTIASVLQKSQAVRFAGVLADFAC
jgi:hypothetical protein